MVRWFPLMKTGVEAIDRLHEQLLERLDRLGAAMRRGRGRERVKEFRKFLETHMGTHFAFEEALMRNEEFPGREEHEAAHREFMAGLAAPNGSRAREESSEANLAELLDLHGYVMGWLAEHEIPADGAFGDYLEERRASQPLCGKNECVWPAVHSRVPRLDGHPSRSPLQRGEQDEICKR